MFHITVHNCVEATSCGNNWHQHRYSNSNQSSHNDKRKYTTERTYDHELFLLFLDIKKAVLVTITVFYPVWREKGLSLLQDTPRSRKRWCTCLGCCKQRNARPAGCTATLCPLAGEKAADSDSASPASSTCPRRTPWPAPRPSRSSASQTRPCGGVSPQWRRRSTRLESGTWTGLRFCWNGPQCWRIPRQKTAAASPAASGSGPWRWRFARRRRPTGAPTRSDLWNWGQLEEDS